MKSTILPLFLIGLLFAVPALSQGEKKDDDLAKRMEALEKQVAAQQKAIESLEKRAEQDKTAAADLVKKLKVARKGGFTYPAPNTEAKEALLSGLESYADTATK